MLAQMLPSTNLVEVSITYPQLESKSETDQLAASVEESNYPPTKCARFCSHCRGHGHTKTVCGKIMCPALLS